MFVTRPFWLGYSFFLSYSVCNAAYTYWMDSTCLTPEYAPGVNKALTEIFNTCKATDAKMANALPDHLKITFHLLFGDPDGGIEDDPVLTKNVKGRVAKPIRLSLANGWKIFSVLPKIHFWVAFVVSPIALIEPHRMFDFTATRIHRTQLYQTNAGL